MGPKSLGRLLDAASESDPVRGGILELGRGGGAVSRTAQVGADFRQQRLDLPAVQRLLGDGLGAVAVAKYRSLTGVEDQLLRVALHQGLEQRIQSSQDGPLRGPWFPRPSARI